MKMLLTLLALTFVASAPLVEPVAETLPDPPGPIIVGPKGRLTAAGDTLRYTASWGPGARATSYDVRWSVAATNGTWSIVADSNGSGKWTTGNGVGALPTTANVTLTTLRTWVSAIPWDSATFTVAVNSRNAVGTSTPVSATWKVSRRPGAPGPITIDSSLIVTGLLLFPEADTIGLGESRVFCAFQKFGNGAVAQFTPWRASCDSIYTRYVPATARQLVRADQQAHTDSIAITCVTWSPSSAAVQLTPLEPCASAAIAKGLQLTMRQRQRLFDDGIRVGLR